MRTKNKKLRPNSYENFFSEPTFYDDGYGYAVAAKGKEDAIKKYLEYFQDYHWITDDHRKYLAADLRSNLKNCWVRWQGWLDDDGEFRNGWVITSEYHGGQKGWFHVYSSDYERHYVERGHHFEHQVEEDGRQIWNRDCNVCGQTA